jgi:hypothetical protein
VLGCARPVLDVTNEPRETEGRHPRASDGSDPTPREADAAAGKRDECQEREGRSPAKRERPGAGPECLRAAAEHLSKDKEEEEHAGPAKGPDELSAEMRRR